MRSLRWWQVAVFLLFAGCLPQARRALHTEPLLLANYAHVPMSISLETVDELLERLKVPDGGLCIPLLEPCLVSLSADPDVRAFCLRWHKKDQCFVAHAERAGVLLTSGTSWTPTQAWLCRTLDPDWQMRRTQAELVADEEVGASERAPVTMSAFWAQARATGSLGSAVGIGVQAQGGYRRWLSQYLLVSVGAGYERGLVRAGPGSADALMFTARLEISSFDEAWQKTHLGLPALSGYFGISGVVGLSTQPTWTTRAFVGLSCIVPLSFELGFEVANEVGGGPRPYAAVGLGI